jgi:hypothetical protein
MQYHVSINQLSITKLFPSLDLKDAAIIDYLHRFMTTKAASKERIVFEGDDYYWTSHEMLIREMPLLKIENERVMKRRIDGLIEAGVLLRHPNCRELNRTYVAFTEKSEGIWSDIETYAPKSTETYAPKSTETYAPKSTDKHIDNNKRQEQNYLQPSSDGKQISSKEKRIADFQESLSQYVSEYGQEMIDEFVAYWTESGEGNKKLRFECQKFFERPKRLATWKKRSLTKFGQKAQPTKSEQEILDAVAAYYEKAWRKVGPETLKSVAPKICNIIKNGETIENMAKNFDLSRKLSSNWGEFTFAINNYDKLREISKNYQQ